MTSPLTPIGIAALGSLAVQTMRNLHPGDFIRELCGADREPRETDGTAASAVDVSVELEHAIPAFMAKLRDQLQSAGVDTQQPFVLKEDGWGGVVVDGDHPDRNVIEELLASETGLRSEFQSIATAATIQRDSVAPSFAEFRLRIEGPTAAIGFE